MMDWSKPRTTVELNLVGVNVMRLLPAMSEIPPEFRVLHGGNKWLAMQQQWFFRGICAHGLKPKEGVSKDDAIAHLSMIQESFAPQHEHKKAAVAYLASLWFTEDSTWEPIKTSLP
jgi:hypothetical protein